MSYARHVDGMQPEKDPKPLTPAERAEIDQRIAEDDADPEDVVSWQQAKEMIQRPRGGRGSSSPP